jgi:hypothetical protein
MDFQTASYSEAPPRPRKQQQQAQTQQQLQAGQQQQLQPQTQQQLQPQTQQQLQAGQQQQQQSQARPKRRPVAEASIAVVQQPRPLEPVSSTSKGRTAYYTNSLKSGAHVLCTVGAA